MELEVNIEYLSSIKALIKRYPSFAFLEKVKLEDRNDLCWDLSGKPCYEIQVLFLGKTGYGKSTTINKIIGENIFRTSEVEVCTKELHSAEYQINDSDYYFSLNDFPGIGESEQADIKYLEWYREMLGRSPCVVYLLRADQRDYSLDEALFQSLFPGEEDRKKVIIGLNFSDKVEPVNRHGGITKEQEAHLQEKVQIVKMLFGVTHVIYYSAQEEINIDKLTGKIVNVVQSCFKNGNRG